MRKTTDKTLVGNAFPMTLIRNHEVAVSEMPVAALARLLAESHVVSFWGHENTRAAAEALLHVGLRPATARPAIALDAAGYPSLDGESFSTCYVLSPDYREGHRPAVGAEVADAEIRGWHALKLKWKD